LINIVIALTFLAGGSQAQKQQTFVQPKSMLSCDELGWISSDIGNGAVCSQVADGNNEVCSELVNAQDAETHCSEMGARLCTVEER
jgi:hypothetical protein